MSSDSDCSKPNTQHDPKALSNELICAVNEGHAREVELLLGNGADPNATDENGFSALMIAVLSYHLRQQFEIVYALLSKGANVNAKDKDGSTVLMHAAEVGRPNIIFLLIDKRPEVNAINIHGDTALTLAKRQGNSDAIGMLMRAGAKGDDPSVWTTSGGLPSLGKKG